MTRRDRPPPLLTLDEARGRAARSAMGLVKSASFSAPALAAVLWGEADVADLPDALRRRAARHRRLLGELRRTPWGWAIDEELEGVASYASVDRGDPDG